MPQDLELTVLSRADVLYLQEMIHEHRSRPPGQVQPSGPSQWRGDDNRNEAADFYTVKAPSAGVPAQGSAYCEVFANMPQASGSSVLMDMGFPVQVYNPSTSAIAAGTFFQAAREKYGQWQALAMPSTTFPEASGYSLAKAVAANTITQVNVGQSKQSNGDGTVLSWVSDQIVVNPPGTNVFEFSAECYFTSTSAAAEGDIVQLYLQDTSSPLPVVYAADLGEFFNIAAWGTGANFGTGSDWWAVTRLAGAVELSALTNLQLWIQSSKAGNVDQPTTTSVFKFAACLTVRQVA